MAIDDYWFKNAVLYCLNVATYMDCNGDGIGDFEGLSRRFDYLAGLGVTCVWLQPFNCSPNRDNGYDVSDYYGVTPRFGTAGDFVECMNTAHALGLRVVVDLVANHTSVDHPWFQEARADPKSPYRDWYVWANKRPRNHAQGTVFPPVQKTTWTRDKKAGQYYFHRLAPMLGNDRRRLELAYSLLFSLPGTPMIQYGDEIGMGDDLSLNEREATRTPMQWTSEPNGGFTTAKKSVLPVVDGGVFGYQKVNVNAQRRDPDSFMNWITRLIRVRKECLEIAWGECEVMDCDADPVLVLVYRFREAAMVSLHNFSDVAQTLRLKVRDKGRERLVDLIGSEHSRAGPRGTHEIALDGYGYRWYRIGAVDETLTRAPY